MKIKELMAELRKIEEIGYGDKDIYMDDGQGNFHIDSVQKNTNPDVEPDYFFLMQGECKETP